jgi:hypothetical protein
VFFQQNDALARSRKDESNMHEMLVDVESDVPFD